MICGLMNVFSVFFAENDTEDSNSNIKIEEKSSSNVSEEFEKIESGDLKDQLNEVINCFC